METNQRARPAKTAEPARPASPARAAGQAGTARRPSSAASRAAVERDRSRFGRPRHDQDPVPVSPRPGRGRRSEAAVPDGVKPSRTRPEAVPPGAVRLGETRAERIRLDGRRPGTARPGSPRPAAAPAPPLGPGRTFRTRPPTVPGAAPENRARGSVTLPRRPFAMLILALLGGGLVCLLIINTTLGAASFKISQLQSTGVALAQQEQSLQRQIADEKSPEQIQQRAYQLGMRQPDQMNFVDLRTHRACRLSGKAGAASEPDCSGAQAAGSQSGLTGTASLTGTAGPAGTSTGGAAASGKTAKTDKPAKRHKTAAKDHDR